MRSFILLSAAIIFCLTVPVQAETPAAKSSGSGSAANASKRCIAIADEICPKDQGGRLKCWKEKWKQFDYECQFVLMKRIVARKAQRAAEKNSEKKSGK